MRVEMRIRQVKTPISAFMHSTAHDTIEQTDSNLLKISLLMVHRRPV